MIHQKKKMSVVNTMKQINDADNIASNEIHSEMNNALQKLTKNADFFGSPLENILCLFSKGNITLPDKYINIFEGKEALLLLQKIDVSQNFPSYPKALYHYGLHTNCSILQQFCNLYKGKQQTIEIDYEYELQQKDNKIDKLKQQIIELKLPPKIEFEPIQVKPKDFESNIFKACKKGNLQSVQWLIEKTDFEFNPHECNKKGLCAIHIASKKGYLRIVQYFIEKMNVDINVQTYRKIETPLSLACKYNHIPIIGYLIYKGADPNTKVQFGNRVIHYATKNGYLNIVQYLIEKANVDINSYNGNWETPFYLACESGHLPIVEYLISKGADVSAKDANGDCAIHVATIKGYLQIVQYLIEKANININIKGNNDQTPLHYACQQGNLSIIKYLISKGANINEKNKNGDYAIDTAVKNKQLPVVKYFTEEKTIDIKNNLKKMVFLACVYKNFSALDYLIANGANGMIQLNNGDYVIHFASKLNQLSVVRNLIEKQNVDVDIRGFDDQTPLHYACQEGHIQMVKYLISKDANVNEKDKKEMTPLHCAAFAGILDIVKVLIYNGADPYARNSFKQTPYDIADKDEIRNFLKSIY